MASVNQKQSGFIVLMGILLLVLGAGIWFGSLGSLKSNQLKLQKDQVFQAQLNVIKQRLLQYAVLHPEIYSDNDLTTEEPGVGYLPCPDINGDGEADAQCGSATNDQLFVIGLVPQKISSKRFSFLDSDLNNRLFWYAVDARFVQNSQVYQTPANNRFAGLNVTLPNQVPDPFNPGSLITPITLNNQDDIVAVIFYANQPLAGQNPNDLTNYSNFIEQPIVADGNAINFTSSGDNPDTFNDSVISITRSEWEDVVLRRVTADRNNDGIADLCVAPETTTNNQHWFNACSFRPGAGIPARASEVGCAENPDLGLADNYSGQNWREMLCD